MSDIIRLLPDHVANQIAAGEVVQRPASVVKELVENSIDAGATKIDLVIKDAGRTLIQVIDNGKGMSYTDARLCFERHATSKITSASDLFAIQTKGFRGEALASISAIAHVKMQTKQADQELGTKLEIEGSKISGHEPVACSNGTNFEVKNLFYNVPARRNFLKSNQVEFKHIVDEFERIAIPHHQIAFTLVHNDQEVFHLNPAPLRKRIVDLFGKHYNDRLVPITENTEIVEINGFVAKPEAARKTRGEQFFFVNNRFFKDAYFNHAVASAFENILPAKMYPGYFLFLEVNPQQIDVNVHPTKTEIKFEEDKSIYQILRSSVQLGLGKFNIMPTLDFNQESGFDIPYEMRNQTPVAPEIKINKYYNPFENENKVKKQDSFGSPFTSAIKSAGFGSVAQSSSSLEDMFQMNGEYEVDIEQTSLNLDVATVLLSSNFISVGPFLICASNNGLLIIHARRAKERLIYNQLMKNFMLQPLASQQLLFPMEKALSKQDRLLWEDNQLTLKRIGFDWNTNSSEFELTAIPAELTESTVIPCVDKIIECLQMDNLDKGEIAHTVLAQTAFASSISFQLSNESEALKEFVSSLLQTNDHTYTPKGKKIITELTNESIFQLF